MAEKENGTIEQINVTPIHNYQFIMGKLIPFWLIALFELGFGLFLGRILFIFQLKEAFTVVWFCRGISYCDPGVGTACIYGFTNPAAAMFLNFFFLITFVLMSGIFTPAESMPHWAQQVNIINPLSYFMRVIRMILLKGSGWSDIQGDFLNMSVYAVASVSLATWRYRKIA